MKYSTRSRTSFSTTITFDIDYDLSHVLFIATANTLSTLQQPLLDRLEIIDLSGYLPEEKIEIARRHLLPRVLNEHKLDESELKLSDEAYNHIIEEYTAESGVRRLKKNWRHWPAKQCWQRLVAAHSPRLWM